MQDDGGTANGGVDLDPSANTMTIDVASVNDAPAGADATVSTNEDTPYVFTATDFGFSDAVEGDDLVAVKITTLPAAGALLLDGSAVSAGDFVSLADINGGKLTFAPAANANGSGYASFTFQVQDDGGIANGGVDLDQSANTMTIDVASVNDAPVFTSDPTLGTLREHLINSSHNGFDSTSVGVVAASDADGDSLTYSITSDSSGGAFKINGVTGEVLVRDISLLDFEGPGLASDGAYYTLKIRASDGTAYSEQDVKIYLINVTNAVTNGSDNYVDGDDNGNIFTLNNGNDVAFGDEGTDSLTGNNNDDRVFGGVGNDTLNGSNGSDVLYGGSGADTMTGGNNGDTFVFGHDWNSGIDSVTDFNGADGDKVLLVNDYAGLFDTLSAGPGGTLLASQFSAGAGLTTAPSADVRIVYNTSTGALYYDADGSGSAFSAVQFAVLEKVGPANPTLTAADILVGPPPSP